MNRREFAAIAASAALIPGLGSAARAVVTAAGTIDVTEYGAVPGTPDDQSVAIQAALDAASAGDGLLFLPPGRYRVANLTLPQRCRIAGVAGASVLAFGGNGHLLAGQGCAIVRLDDLVIDGMDLPLGETVPGTLYLADCADVAITGCRFTGSRGAALAFDRCGGRLTGNDVTGAAIGMWLVDSTGLSVTGNAVTDCADNGILVHRWEPGEDGTIVSGNRVERIGAASGGTGPYGNGINVYRAHGVTVSGNRIADCAFTAVRANGANAVVITGNNCTRLGETAIYSEFAFEGAVIADNVIDTAATGISVANFIDGGRIATVTGNIVRNLTGSGPYPADPPGFGNGIYVEAESTVSGNVVEGGPLAGIWLGWGPYLRNVVVTGNIVRGTRFGFAVSVVEGTGTVVIADNLVAETAEGGVFGYRWAERVTGELIDGPSPNPSLLLSNNRLG
ncbi:MAG: TIGR03808 family TAT-translocated repetitive protein [Bauldia sp.]|nr:TIGR03808 family TAT-translocated repetitive protein [Bauldia sp.]